jgi:S1-C subfamily serine protease
VRSLLKSIITLTLMLGIGIISPDIHNHLIRSQVGSGVVKVFPSNRTMGTGFAMKTSSGMRVVVTNEHVCSASLNNRVNLVSDNGMILNKKILYKDNKHDICLIEGDYRLKTLRLANTPDKGDIHFIVGHPSNRSLTISKGEYIGDKIIKLPDFKIKERKNCDGKIFELNILEQMIYGLEFVCVKNFASYSSSAISYGGNSGSPVVNTFGNVIGILFAGNPSQNTDSYLVPLSELKRVLSKF